MTTADSKKRRARKIVSCLACHSKKKKCNKKLPCDQCISKGLGDKCGYQYGGDLGSDFGPPSLPFSSSTGAGPGAGPPFLTPNSPSDSASTSPDASVAAVVERPVAIQFPDTKVERFLASFGYSDSSLSQNGLRDFVKEADQLTEVSAALPISPSEFENFLTILPGRQLCELLFNQYFDHISWQYFIVSESQFREQWVGFLSCKSKITQIPLLGLVFRLLALAAQYVSATRPPEILSLMTANVSVATRVFHEAADRINAIAQKLSPCLETIQERMLAALFEKNNGQIRQSWIVLGQAIRIAQAMNMGPDTVVDSARSTEAARLLWWSIRSWDILTALSLDRPITITTYDKYKDTYNLPTTEDADWAVLRKYHWYKARLSYIIGPLAPEWRQPKSSGEIEWELDQFVVDIDPHFRIDSTDTSLDSKYPNIQLQRVVLAVTVLSQRSALYSDSIIARDVREQRKLLDCTLEALRLINSIILHPNMATAFTGPFSTFNAGFKACIAVMALLKEQQPLDEQVLDPLKEAIDNLGKLSPGVKNAVRGRAILSHLYSVCLSKLRAARRATGQAVSQNGNGSAHGNSTTTSDSNGNGNDNDGAADFGFPNFDELSMPLAWDIVDSAPEFRDILQEVSSGKY